MNQIDPCHMCEKLKIYLREQNSEEIYGAIYCDEALYCNMKIIQRCSEFFRKQSFTSA